MTESNVKASVESLLRKYANSASFIDPETIAEGEGVDVRYANFKAEASDIIHGFYDFEAKKIVINAADSVEEKLFTIAHELGHYILHQEYSKSARYVPRLKEHSDTPEEREADEFAVRLLVPLTAIKDKSPYKTRKELAANLLVTEETLRKAYSLYAGAQGLQDTQGEDVSVDASAAAHA